MKSIPRYLFVVFCQFALANLSLAQWVQTNSPFGGIVKSFAVSGTNLFVGVSGIGVFLSTNNGTSWTPINTGLLSPNVWALAISDTYIFAGTLSNFGGVYRSSNSGVNWAQVNSGLTNTDATTLAISDTNLFAGTLGLGVFRSTNNGTSWNWVSNGLLSLSINALAISGASLFAATYGGVFLTMDNGTSWANANAGLPTSSNILAFAVSGTSVYAGTYGGVFVTNDNGGIWGAASAGLPTNTNVNALAVSGTNLFAGTTGSGAIFVSTNNGTSWTAVTTGIPTSATVNALVVSGTNLFAGTSVGVVWRRPLSEMITSVDRLSTDLPTQFSLDQNYPNPFNPVTTFSFSLPSASFVSLKVFDALGREMSTVLAEELTAGTYAQQWSAAGLASGVYFYRLQAGEFVETRKLLLLR